MRFRLCSCAFALALVLSDFAGTASAHSVVVDPAGGGDFVTIQAAVNSVAASFAPETVIVRAGAYAETVTLPQRDSQSLLVCTAGPESTSVAGLVLGPSTYGTGSTHRDWTVRGLTVGTAVTSVPQKARARFEQCAFTGGLTVNWLEGGVAMPVADCDFAGPTQLLGIYGTAQSLRFRHAPLRTEPRVGGLYYTDCAFVGVPGETLVVAPRTEDLGFTRCTFDSAGVGVWFPNGGFAGLTMSRCRFHRLALAVGELPIPLVSVLWSTRPLAVNDSRWDYCDRAVSWPGGVLVLARDTLRFCGEAAVHCKVEIADFRNLLVEDNLGTALDVTLAQSSPSQDPSAALQQSLFRRVAGAGARIRQSEYPDVGSIWLGSCRFERCEIGADLMEASVHAQGCVFFANAQHGLVLTPSFGMIVSVASNSFVANGGDGFWLRPDAYGLPVLIDVHQDLAVHNSGAGMRLEGSLPYTFSRNDSWSNAGGDFVGVTPDTSDFSLDPRFCGIASGDLMLSSDSPCASGDSLTVTGALGVGCSLPTTGVAPGSGLAAFAVHPNPSRGAFEFALPALASAGRLDVLDLQGRVVWSRTVTSAERVVRWESGPAAPGLYWGRFTAPGRTETRTLVRLR